MEDQSQSRLDVQFPFLNGERVLATLRLLTRALEARLGNLEAQRATYDAAVDELIQVALFRIDDVLRPALVELDKAANTGFPADRITDAGVAGKRVLQANTHASLVAALALTFGDLPGVAKAESPDLGTAPTADTPSLATNSRRLATTAFVQALVASLVDSSPAALDTLKELAAALGNDANFSTTVLTQIADRYTKSQADTAFTRRRNRVVNPGVRYSLEKGLNPTILTGLDGAYIVDGFLGVCRMTATVNFRQIKSRAPSGSQARLRATVTDPQATVASNHYCGFQWRFEGNDIADLAWGTTAAKSAVVRFVANLPAGLYTLAVRNGAVNYSYLVQFRTFSADSNKDKEWAFVIPGPASGTWPDDNTLGLLCDLTLSAGSAMMGTAGWQSGSVVAISGQFAFLATAGNVAELMDVGLYSGSVAPMFELPDFAEDLRKCMRYFELMNVNVSQKSAGSTGAYAASREPLYFSEIMRVNPAVAIVGIYGGQVNDGNGGYRAPVAGDINVFSYTGRTGGAWFKNLGRGDDYADFQISVNARL